MLLKKKVSVSYGHSNAALQAHQCPVASNNNLFFLSCNQLPLEWLGLTPGSKCSLISSMYIILGIRPKTQQLWGVSSHDYGRKLRGQNQTSGKLFLSLLMSCHLISYWPRQVTWLSPTSIGQGSIRCPQGRDSKGLRAVMLSTTRNGTSGKHPCRS